MENNEAFKWVFDIVKLDSEDAAKGQFKHDDLTFTSLGGKKNVASGSKRW